MDHRDRRKKLQKKSKWIIGIAEKKLQKKSDEVIIGIIGITAKS